MDGNATTTSSYWLTSGSRAGFILVLSFIAFVAFFGNSLVLMIAVKSSKMRTTNNCFIFNLALCDCLVGCCSIPMMIATMIAEKWVFGDVFCYIGAFLDNLVMIQSIWTLAALSVFRAMSVLDPFKLKQRRIRRKVLIVLFVMWLVAGVFVAAPCYGWSSYSFSSMSFNCGTSPGEGIHRYFFIIFIVMALFCPISVVVTSYVIILYTALSNFTVSPRQEKRRFFQRKKPLEKQNSHTSGRSGEVAVTPTESSARILARHSGLMATVAMGSNGAPINRFGKTKSKISLKLQYFHSRSAKSSIRVLIIVGVFLVCVGPLLIIAFIMTLGGHIEITNTTGFIVYIIALSHSAINPCIYGLCDQRFREAYKALFVRARPVNLYSHRSNANFLSGTDVTRLPVSQDTSINLQCNILTPTDTDK